MTQRDVLRIACRIVGILLIMNLIEIFPSYLLSTIALHADDPFMTGMALAMLIGPTIYLLLAGILLYLLFIRADTVAAYLLREDRPLPFALPAQWEKAVFTLALRILGVVCIYHALPLVDVLRFLLSLERYSSLYDAPELFGNIAYLLFGWYLLFRGQWLIARVGNQQAAE